MPSARKQDKLVLVACPTAASKDYSLDKYLEAFDAYEWGNKHLFMVDTTFAKANAHAPVTDYHAVLLERGIDAERISLGRPLVGRVKTVEAVTRAWPMIVRRAKQLGADYIFSNEVDVICPPETIRVLVDVAERYKAVHVAHSYPVRVRGAGHTFGVGMNLFRGDLFSETELTSGKGIGYTQFEYYAYEKCESRNLPIIKMQSVIPGVVHLDEPGVVRGSH